MTQPPTWLAANRAHCASVVADLFAPLRRYVGLDVEPNPLALGRFCDCGTRLEGANACPMCREAA